MRAVQAICAWHAEERDAQTGPAGGQSQADRIRVLIESGFSATMANIDQIRNEVEVQRLQFLAERQFLEQKQAELEFERSQIEAEKQDIKE